MYLFIYEENGKETYCNVTLSFDMALPHVFIVHMRITQLKPKVHNYCKTLKFSKNENICNEYSPTGSL